MFKVSTKGDYGLVLMSELAVHYGEGFVSLKKIAKEKGLSLPYLSQIVIPLKKAKLVESKEGINGGYILAKHPGEISFMDILTAIEGPIKPVNCMKNKTCRCESACGTKQAWKDAAEMITSFFEQKTLADTITNQPKEDAKATNS